MWVRRAVSAGRHKGVHASYHKHAPHLNHQW
jgi:hypothetical protein